MIDWDAIKMHVVSDVLTIPQLDALCILAENAAYGQDDWCDYCDAVKDTDGRLPIVHEDWCPIAVLERVGNTQEK